MHANASHCKEIVRKRTLSKKILKKKKRVTEINEASEVPALNAIKGVGSCNSEAAKKASVAARGGARGGEECGEAAHVCRYAGRERGRWGTPGVGGDARWVNGEDKCVCVGGQCMA